MIVLWALILLSCIAWGIKQARKEVAVLSPPVAEEKTGRIYFLQHQNNPSRVKIVMSKGELATPLKIIHEVLTPTPKAVLSQMYRDLETSHLGAGWYDADSVLMYLDHLRGTA